MKILYTCFNFFTVSGYRMPGACTSSRTKKKCVPPRPLKSHTRGAHFIAGYCVPKYISKFVFQGGSFNLSIYGNFHSHYSKKPYRIFRKISLVTVIILNGNGVYEIILQDLLNTISWSNIPRLRPFSS